MNTISELMWMLSAHKFDEENIRQKSGKSLRDSYCSYTWPTQPGPIWWLGSLRSNLVIKLVSVLFGRCTTLMVGKGWPMETRLSYGDQWKAEKLGAFWCWPVTRCFIKSNRAGLIIEHSINFRLNGEHSRAMQFWRGRWTPTLSLMLMWSACKFDEKIPWI